METLRDHIVTDSCHLMSTPVLLWQHYGEWLRLGRRSSRIER
jgi:hypothetical protein